MSNDIKDLMRTPLVVRDDETLESVLTKMVAQHGNSAAVVDSSGAFVGLVSTNDIIRAVLPDYLEDDPTAAKFADENILKEDVGRARELMAKDFMQTKAATITEDTGLVEAAVIAAKFGHGRIIVVDDAKKPIGIVTRTELKRVIAEYLGIKDK